MIVTCSLYIGSKKGILCNMSGAYNTPYTHHTVYSIADLECTPYHKQLTWCVYHIVQHKAEECNAPYTVDLACTPYRIQ
jgi:hypothetical protein